MRLAILMLQTFAGERRAPGRPAEHEAARPRVAGGPDQIPDPLEPEHRVINEERNGVDAVGGVSGAGGDERRHRSGFGDAFLEDLAVRRFLVIQKRVHIDRLVDLPDM